MGTVRRLAEEVERGLKTALPKLRKTVVDKVALAVGAMIEVRTPNTAELANVLPLETARQDLREQWLRRLLKNSLLSSPVLLGPWARQALAEASRHGQTVVLSLDQTDLGDRFAVWMLGLVLGDRAWTVAAGPANIGFADQQRVLERVRGWLPDGVAVLLLADRFYPSAALFGWLHRQGWQYPVALEGQPQRRPGVRRYRHHRGTGGGGHRTLPARCAPVGQRRAHEPGHSARGGASGSLDHRDELPTDQGGRARLRQSLGHRAAVFGGSPGSPLVAHGPRPALVRLGRTRGGLPSPDPAGKNPRNKPTPTIGPLKTRPQRLVPVQARSTVAPETAPNATTLTVLPSRLLGHEELIGGKDVDYCAAKKQYYAVLL